MDFEVVICHGPGCADGAFCAWLAWRSLSDYARSFLRGRGGFYGSPPRPPRSGSLSPTSLQGALVLQARGAPSVIAFSKPKTPLPPPLVRGRRVLICDLDLGGNLASVVEEAKSVTLVDHHLASTDLPPHPKLRCVLDKNSCASSLLWPLLFEGPPPPLLDVVRVGDTWSWKENPEAEYLLEALHEEKAFSTLCSIESTVASWEAGLEERKKRGRQLLSRRREEVEGVAAAASLGWLLADRPYRVASVASSSSRSRVAQALLSRFPEAEIGAVCRYSPETRQTSVSLRTDREGIDLGRVAALFGGGGHPRAASFRLSPDNLARVLGENPGGG